MIKISFTALLRTIGLSVLLVAGTLNANTAVEPVPRDAKWQQRHQSLVELGKAGGIELLFLGDSITQNWERTAPEGGRAVWEKEFAPLKAANFGISGDRTQHLLWRIAHGELDSVSPKVLVLLIGTNNTGLERESKIPRNSVPEAIEGVTQVVAAVKAKLPATKILLLAILPRAEKPDDSQRKQVGEINAALAKLHDGKQIFFLDFTRRFLSPDGILSAKIMPDFLHPNEAGYRILADALRAPLADLNLIQKPTER